MAADLRKARARRLADKANEKYGEKAASLGHIDWGTKYYSTGTPAIDYLLGTGGLPDNAFAEVFGIPQIGKTSTIGSGVLCSVHRSGGITATVATEPDFDEVWMERLGVDPELNIVYRPDTGEEAFEILRDLVYDKAVDYILFDSLAGTSSEKEQGSEKPQAFGNAALNSWGIRNVATRAFKNHVGVLFINQVRDDTNSKIKGVLKSPGGHTVEHFMKVRIQLKPGKDSFKVKVPSMEGGNEDLLVGRQVRAAILKNKAAEGLGKQAVFDFYHVETDEFPFGFDRAQDLIRTAKTAGVLQGSGWLNHPAFPDGKINGQPKAIEYVRENSKAFDAIYADVMRAAVDRSNQKALEKRKAKKSA